MHTYACKQYEYQQMEEGRRPPHPLFYQAGVLLIEGLDYLTKGLTPSDLQAHHLVNSFIGSSVVFQLTRMRVFDAMPQGYW